MWSWVKRSVALLMVLVMVGSVMMPVMAAQTEVHKKPIKIVVKKNSKTLTVVQVNDVLITLRSNKDLTKATLEIMDLKTHRTYIYVYKVNKRPDGRYTVEMYGEGKLISKYRTNYNPLDPSVTRKLLTENSRIKGSVGVLSYSYWWDGVKFVKGYGVKYPHPDYAYYQIEPWDNGYVNGNRLIHYHISDYNSQKIAGLPPVVVGAVIGGIVGGYLGEGVGGVVGAIVGGILALWFSSDLSHILLDEHGCIWFWFSKSFSWVAVPVPPYLAWIPNYFRIASYTLWDALRIGNP